MPPKKEPQSVLIVSGTEKGFEFIKKLLAPSLFSPVFSATSADAVKRMLIDGSFDLVIINTPLPDEFGTQLALDIASAHSSGILLIVRNDYFEQTSYAVEDSGILTISKPATAQNIYQAIKLLTAARARICELEQKEANLQAKMEEIRIVNHAKWILIDHLKMDEKTAHRHIEKQAMDRRLTRGEIAREIIATYES